MNFQSIVTYMISNFKISDDKIYRLQILSKWLPNKKYYTDDCINDIIYINLKKNKF